MQRGFMNSKFVNDVVKFILNSKNVEEKIKHQIDFLIEDEYEYTGIGVFVGFKHKENIEKYRAKEENLIITGVKIKSPELKLAASTILFFKDGLIDYLEISSYQADYPNTDLKNYKLELEQANIIVK